MLGKIIIFLAINLAALGLGGLLMGDGASSDWYQALNKAPWTPPGWMFGFAWLSIMICFALYMAYLWSSQSMKKTIGIVFLIQWILNVAWNPIFFGQHEILLALVVITLLSITITWFLFNFYSKLQSKSFLILPYFIWLLIATSLNAYILFNN